LMALRREGACDLTDASAREGIRPWGWAGGQR
jgi:hypothetical protein